MAILQGNTYLMPVQITDCDGVVVDIDQVEKGEFTFGNITKFYGEDGVVVWDAERKAFIVPLTEEETFGFKDVVRYQGRVLLKDGTVNGSVPCVEYLYESIGVTRLSEGNNVGSKSGSIVEVKLLERVGGGVSDYEKLSNKPSINGIELLGNKLPTEIGVVGEGDEVDPTVPNHVKQITEENITNWNGKVSKGEFDNKVKEINTIVSGLESSKASTEYVDKRVADLVNSAPDALDTLGELAIALKENKDIVDALKVPTKTSELQNDSGFITKEDVPQTDLTNYYTKSETEEYVNGVVGNINAALETILGV